MTEGIDAELTRGGVLSGTITAEDTGEPLENVRVNPDGANETGIYTMPVSVTPEVTVFEAITNAKQMPPTLVCQMCSGKARCMEGRHEPSQRIQMHHQRILHISHHDI
jgi:hypothetical protein